LGEYNSARAWDMKALEASRSEGQDRNREAEYYALLNLATDELDAGQIEQASTYRRKFESILDNAEYSRFRWMNRYHLLCAQIELALGHHESAIESTSRALRCAEDVPVPKNVCKSNLYEGQVLLALGRVDEAVVRFQEAMSVADQIEHGSLRWKARLRLGQANALLGQANADLYRQALRLVETTADRLQDDAVRTLFLASPLVLELRANARSAIEEPVNHRTEMTLVDAYPAGLTAREVEVLRLIAQGDTNRQIGERLTISVKTVNAHVTNILNKTGCNNRTAAATFALQHGLIE
jgi:DNA-binding CsgD family transcriptional regulator/tetratricopeptide (TPR) repeat protein